jgi:uncharacterized protein (DUF927 family)
LGLDDRLNAHVARVESQGSLDDWRSEIADRCTTSSYLVFGLAIGFLVPMLQLTRVESKLMSVESGGFHLWARSTRGKTTVQRCVASIFGKGTKEGGGYVRSWKTTMAAMDDTARGHCDLPLILDEMKLLAADPRKAAQLATDTARSQMKPKKRAHLCSLNRLRPMPVNFARSFSALGKSASKHKLVRATPIGLRVKRCG